jgi:hypothetical protein
MNVVMPDVLAVDTAVRSNPVQQIGQLRTVVEGTLAGFTRQRLEGKLFRSESGDEVLILPAKPRQALDGHERILIADSAAPDGDWDLGGAVICVDMLGEGFDLPELKIAAFHDIRKSLAVTLQLAGRFTRFRPDLGEATFIANIAM